MDQIGVILSSQLHHRHVGKGAANSLHNPEWLGIEATDSRRPGRWARSSGCSLPPASETVLGSRRFAAWRRSLPQTASYQSRISCRLLPLLCPSGVLIPLRHSRERYTCCKSRMRVIRGTSDNIHNRNADSNHLRCECHKVFFHFETSMDDLHLSFFIKPQSFCCGNRESWTTEAFCFFGLSAKM